MNVEYIRRVKELELWDRQLRVPGVPRVRVSGASGAMSTNTLILIVQLSVAFKPMLFLPVSTCTKTVP